MSDGGTAMASGETHDASIVNGNDNSNGAPKDLERNAKHDSVDSKWRFSVVIEDFSFVWFTLSMNTGILSILLHQLPYRFNGIGVLSTILFVLNLVLFSFFFIMLLLRIAMFPKTIAHSFKTDFTELTMTGAIAIAWFTLTAQVGLTVTQASWGGPAWFIVCYVMWWIGTAVMFGLGAFVFIMIAKTSVTDLESLNPSIVLPFVGTTTDAVVGALIVSYSADVSARLAIPVIIVSYILAGVGLWVALLAFAMYWTRLMNHGLPPPEQSPSLFLLIGPPGQVAAAVTLLGYASSLHFGSYNKGTFLTSQSGMTLSTIGVFFGLMILGLALLFMVFAVYVIIDLAFRRKHSYSLLWWSTIFPLATVDTAFIAFATALNSPAFRGLAEGLFLILFVVYVVNTGFTLLQIWQGKLLSGRRKEKKEQ